MKPDIRQNIELIVYVINRMYSRKNAQYTSAVVIEVVSHDVCIPFMSYNLRTTLICKMADTRKIVINKFVSKRENDLQNKKIL